MEFTGGREYQDFLAEELDVPCDESIPKHPALKYYGGKWSSANKIISFFPEHKTFVDVFCGAASVTIRKPRSKNEIINDVNGELVHFFRVLRDRNLELRTLLEKTPYARDEYYACREDTGAAIERARRTVVKSWFGIGDSLDNKSGFRVSLSQGGSTTAPWVTYVDYLHLFANRLRGVIVENLDWRECIERYDKIDTLFYLDPPYMKETRSKRHGYRFDWCDENHQELLEKLPTIKGKFLLSGYATPLYEQLPYKREEFMASTQSIARQEVIWMNFEPANQREKREGAE